MNRFLLFSLFATNFSVSYSFGAPVASKIRGGRASSSCLREEFLIVDEIMGRQLNRNLESQMKEDNLVPTTVVHGHIPCHQQSCEVELVGGMDDSISVDAKQEMRVKDSLEEACEHVLSQLSKDNFVSSGCRKELAQATCRVAHTMATF